MPNFGHAGDFPIYPGNPRITMAKGDGTREITYPNGVVLHEYVSKSPLNFNTRQLSLVTSPFQVGDLVTVGTGTTEYKVTTTYDTGLSAVSTSSNRWFSYFLQDLGKLKKVHLDNPLQDS